MGEKARAGDGVVGGAGRVDGRPVFCYAQDPSYVGGSLGELHADTIVRVLRLAGRARCAGRRLRRVRRRAAAGGRRRARRLRPDLREHVALSRRVPQISVISGASAGGGSYSPALTDFVVMTERATMFLTGPGVVREVMGEDVGAAELGGPKVHERNGVCHFVADDDADAALLVRDLLDHLPANAGERAPLGAPPGRVGSTPATPVPDERAQGLRRARRRPRDRRRRRACSRSAALGAQHRLRLRAPRRPPGRRRRQPAAVPRRRARRRGRAEGRALRAHVRPFGLPLVVLVDTPGFLPGTQQEGAGVIRHGAKLVHAFAEASVPKVTVVLRKAFGGAFIAMNSHELGADLVFAWPQAQLGVMGAKQAVGIVHRRRSPPRTTRPRPARASPRRTPTST